MKGDWIRGLNVAGFVLALAAWTGCGGSAPSNNGGGGDSSVSQTRRLIILINGESPFWDACRRGVQDASQELQLDQAGFVAVVESNDGSPQGQLEKLRQFNTQRDIAAVAVSAIDKDNAAVADELRRLQQRGVKVITIDSDLDRKKFADTRYAFIGTDNFKAGKLLGQCMKVLKPEGGKYVTFVGRTGAQNAIERVGGLAEGAGEKFQRVDNMADENDLTRARENVRHAIQNHPDVSILVGIWSYNAGAIVDVVKQLGVRDRMLIVAFDAQPDAIRYMEQGQIDCLLVQNPYQIGYQAVRMMKAMVQGDKKTIEEMYPNYGKPGGDIYETGLKVVVPDANSPVKPQHVEGQAEFYTLPEFKKWLAKYNLQGS